VICYICSTDKPWPTRRSTVTAVARVSVTPTLIPPRNDEFSNVVLRLDVLLGVDELCQNGLTDRHAVLGQMPVGTRNHDLDGASDSLNGKGIFWTFIILTAKWLG